MEERLARPILVDGDPRLLRMAREIRNVDAAFRADADALAATLASFRARHGFGRAIAAPQIGVDARAIAMDLGAGPILLLNPAITWRSPETFELWDDCFSVPDRLVRVRRHRSIAVEFRDLDFRAHRWDRLPPELAELLQHEIDHLDGVLMTERACGPDAVRRADERGVLVDANRAAPRIAAARIAQAARRVDPVFLRTPQFDCEPLSAALGCALTLKVETLNPVRSFKGRGADWLASGLAEDGADGALVCASAGNFGQALAYACRRRGIALTVFAAADANPLKVERMRALGAVVRLEGRDFDDAKAHARRHAAESGARFVEDGAAPRVTEGAGTIAVELLAGQPAYDAVLVPLGNGALLAGMGRWIRAAWPGTAVVGVCSAGARAMERSWRARRVVEDDARTIADGIAVRVPVPEALADLDGVVDDVVAVDDATVLDAMRRLHAHAGLVVEPAGAVGVAALLADRARWAGRRVATVLCGGNVTAEQFARWRIASIDPPKTPEHP